MLYLFPNSKASSNMSPKAELPNVIYQHAEKRTILAFIYLFFLSLENALGHTVNS